VGYLLARTSGLTWADCSRGSILHFLGVLLVVAVASSFVFAWTARGGLRTGVVGPHLPHISSLAGEVFRDPPALARRVQQLHDELELDLVARDLQGRVLASAGTELPTFTPEQLAQVRTGLRMVQPNPEWSVAIPVAIRRRGGARNHRDLGPPASPPARSQPPRPHPEPAPRDVRVHRGHLARRISRPVERLTGGRADVSAPAISGAGSPGRASHWWRRRDSSSDELADLTRAFNDMAERIERLIAGQKELMANISHELRSPLTRIRVALELLPRNGATQARLADVEA
jgi:signal transduction histidine kinase